MGRFDRYGSAAEAMLSHRYPSPGTRGAYVPRTLGPSPPVHSLRVEYDRARAFPAYDATIEFTRRTSATPYFGRVRVSSPWAEPIFTVRVPLNPNARCIRYDSLGAKCTEWNLPMTYSAVSVLREIARDAAKKHGVFVEVTDVPSETDPYAFDVTFHPGRYGGFLGIQGGLLGVALTPQAEMNKWGNKSGKLGAEVQKLERQIASLERAKGAGRAEVEKLRSGFPGLFDNRKTVDVNEALRRNKERLLLAKEDLRYADKKYREAKDKWLKRTRPKSLQSKIKSLFGGLPIQPAEDQALAVVPRMAAGVDVGMVELVPSPPDMALSPDADAGAMEGAAEFLTSRGVALDPSAPGVADAIALRFGGGGFGGGRGGGGGGGLDPRFYRRSRNRI